MLEWPMKLKIKIISEKTFNFSSKFSCELLYWYEVEQNCLNNFCFYFKHSVISEKYKLKKVIERFL